MLNPNKFRFNLSCLGNDYYKAIANVKIKSLRRDQLIHPHDNNNNKT